MVTHNVVADSSNPADPGGAPPGREHPAATRRAEAFGQLDAIAVELSRIGDVWVEGRPPTCGELDAIGARLRSVADLLTEVVPPGTATTS